MNANDTSLHCYGTDLAVVQEKFQDIDRLQGWMIQSNRLQLIKCVQVCLSVDSFLPEVEGIYIGSVSTVVTLEIVYMQRR